MSATTESHRLEGLGEKIFLDRYAMKDLDYTNTQVGDTILTLTKDDPRFPQKEVGEILSIHGKEVTILLRSGETIQTSIERTTRPLELTPDAMWDRLARSLAAVEKTPEKQAEWQAKFRELLDDWKLVPGGRIAAGAGANDELTLFNCYVIPSPHDSRGGIMDTLTQMTEIMSRGGGVGINLSSLRPRRALVKGVNGSSSGSVSWGGLFSYTTGLIEQGGSRRGALMLMLNDWHPDLLEFITVKQTMGLVTNANLSVCVSNGFMKAVKEDLDWDLIFPDTQDPDYETMWDGNMTKWRDELGKPVKVYKTVRARDIWHTIIESAWKSAEPGIVFLEYYNQMSNSWYFNPIICTNPCGEQGLPGWGVCNLSALNLSKFVADGEVEWDKLGTAVRYAVRFLDNVIDATPYHFEENERNQKNERRVGLGTMGLAEMLIKLGIRYGSVESLEFLEKLYHFIARESYLASSEISQEKGSFPMFDREKFLQSGFMKQFDDEVRETIYQNGIRNVTLLTQAPTGSTGTMVGTSTGIEPFYAYEFTRQSRLGTDKQYVPIAKEWLEANPGEELPDYFVSAMSLSAEDHVRVQAAIQKWVDSSISKTANAPHDFSVEDTKKLYELAFDLGCKGVTIYRDGSRDTQVLSVSKDDEKAEAKASENTTAGSHGKAHVPEKAYNKRPKKLSGATYKMRTPLGKAYITVNDIDGAPFEVIVNVGKAGSDVFAMSEALGRVSTLFLRFGELPDGNKARLLIKQIKGIGGSGAVGFGANRVESIPDAVAKALEMHLDGEDDYHSVAAASHKSAYNSSPEPIHHHADDDDEFGLDSPDLCPSCGSATLMPAEGCKTCTTCGYSKCS
ncbi:adenosylcobalamin-dependent ribonucleoside-diphosphate reductase [Brevibacillus ginsengisoli]|uniref:adenosylcobalamin-dependent ribonucleoside-diphosphate reductase n=1 Tax=Brevibacillus ginsengisoli TaxID=363854 RepID=UPI003CE99340